MSHQFAGKAQNRILQKRFRSRLQESKETYCQTRGWLSNVEMKHIGELVIISLFLKRSYHARSLLSLKAQALFVGFCCTYITKTYVQDS